MQLAPVLEALTALDWVGQVNDAAVGEADVPESRYVLLANPGATPWRRWCSACCWSALKACNRCGQKPGWMGLLLEDVLPGRRGH